MVFIGGHECESQTIAPSHAADELVKVVRLPALHFAYTIVSKIKAMRWSGIGRSFTFLEQFVPEHISAPIDPILLHVDPLLMILVVIFMAEITAPAVKGEPHAQPILAMCVFALHSKTLRMEDKTFRW